VVRAEVLEFTRDTLFAAKGNDAPEERARRQAVLNEFQKRYSEVYNDEFLADTGVHFNNLTFREQAWYLHFVESADEETRVRAKQFVAHYGEDGLRTFLSLEHGDEMGNKILTIGEKLPDRVARAVFVKYAEVVDASNRVSEYLQANYSNIHNFSPEAVSAVSERLLLRARDLLSGFAEDSDKQEVSGKTDLADANSVLEQLQRIKIEVILFADTFRAAQESGVIDFSDIENTELRVIDSGELSREEREEMMDIFVQNRRAYPSKLLEVSQAEFEQALNSGGKEFELLYHNDELVSFIRFDKLPSGNVYSGSFNVRPEAKGSAIGSAMIRATLDKKSESHNIEGEVYAGNPGALKFWERMGFRVSGEIENWKGTGERFIKVFRPKKVKSERLLEAA